MWQVNLLQTEFPHVLRVSPCLRWCNEHISQYPKDLPRCAFPLKPQPCIDFHQVLFVPDCQTVTWNYIITLVTIEMCFQQFTKNSQGLLQRVSSHVEYASRSWCIIGWIHHWNGTDLLAFQWIFRKIYQILVHRTGTHNIWTIQRCITNGSCEQLLIPVLQLVVTKLDFAISSILQMIEVLEIHVSLLRMGKLIYVHQRVTVFPILMKFQFNLHLSWRFSSKIPKK